MRNGFPHDQPGAGDVQRELRGRAGARFRTEREAQVAAAPFNELISGWHKVNGVRPHGAPVGMTVASDGAIWLVEDKNQTIVRIDVDPAAQPSIRCRATPGPPAQIDELAALRRQVMPDKRQRLTDVRTRADREALRRLPFRLRPQGCGINDAQKDEAVLRYLLAQDGWVYPGDQGRPLARSRPGKGPGKIMPAMARSAQGSGLPQSSIRSTCSSTRWCRRARRMEATDPRRSTAAQNCGALPNKRVVVVDGGRRKSRTSTASIVPPTNT